jgi:Tfp pilus assembly protein PilO
VKLSPRDKLIAIAAGLLLVVVVLIVVFVVPQFGKLKSIGAEIEAANTASAQANALLGQRTAIKNEAAGTGSALLRLATAVPASPELPSLIIELQDAAYASGVSLRSVTPADPQLDASGKFVYAELGMEVWGTWADTVDFLGRIRNKLGRAVRVREFNSSVLTELEASPAKLELPPYYQVKTGVKVLTYVIPEGSVAASGTTSTAAPAPAPAPAPAEGGTTPEAAPAPE